DVEWWRYHRPASGLHLAGERARVVCADIQTPYRGRFGRLLRPDAGHICAIEPGHRVTAVLRVRLHLQFPAEEARIELTRRSRVGTREIDPHRLRDNASTTLCHHLLLWPRLRLKRHASAARAW